MIKNYNRTAVKRTVLVGVIKDRRDLGALLTHKWYRIPVQHAPKRRFKYLAFYQPACFGRRGKRIRYYARVLDQRTVRRKDVLPDEPKHPRADDRYFLFRVDNVKKLPRPIRNTAPRRISFGFTALNRLLKSEDILQLYDVAPTEEILRAAFKRNNIKFSAQHYVSSGTKRYYVDCAVFCRRGVIAIECDNTKAHSGVRKKKKDEIKNSALRRLGWTVIRLSEDDIVSDIEGCMLRVEEAVRKCGGMK